MQIIVKTSTVSSFYLKCLYFKYLVNYVIVCFHIQSIAIINYLVVVIVVVENKYICELKYISNLCHSSNIVTYRLLFVM